LNRAAGAVSARIKVPETRLPKRIIDISFREEHSANTIIITCDSGWAVSMRLHSAKSAVEPSLKFDVQLESSPNGVYSAYEEW
jgi:hypothetical protein